MNKYFAHSMYKLLDGTILEFSDYEYEFVSQLADSEPIKVLWENGLVEFSRLVKRIDDDEVEVTFVLSKRAWFWFAHRIEERGLVFSSDNSVRESGDSLLIVPETNSNSN